VPGILKKASYLFGDSLSLFSRDAAVTFSIDKDAEGVVDIDDGLALHKVIPGNGGLESREQEEVDHLVYSVKNVGAGPTSLQVIEW
jgi:hypothetical protein